MGKKKVSARKSDAERRMRQGQRLARVVRALRCIAGPGRWDAGALAQELEVSVRSVHRILAVLTEAGIPFKYDPDTRSYRVPKGFSFPGLDISSRHPPAPTDPAVIRPAARRLQREIEQFSKSLAAFCDALDN